MSLSWSAPVSDGGSAITNYLIQYNTAGATTTFSHSPSTATSTTITGLTPSTLYTFSVSAVNSSGTSSPATLVASTSAIVVTIPDEQPDPIVSTSTPVEPVVSTRSGGSSGGSSNYVSYNPVFINTIQNQNNNIKTDIKIPSKTVFTKVLKTGSINNDVKNLQIFLNNNGFTISKIKGSAGSKGYETKTFGSLTRTALINFQKKNKIYPSDGTLNNNTIKFINSYKK